MKVVFKKKAGDFLIQKGTNSLNRGKNTWDYLVLIASMFVCCFLLLLCLSVVFDCFYVCLLYLIASMFVCCIFVPLGITSLIWRPHHCRWMAAGLKPMLGTYGLRVQGGIFIVLYLFAIRDLGFLGLIRRTGHSFTTIKPRVYTCILRIYSNPVLDIWCINEQLFN